MVKPMLYMEYILISLFLVTFARIHPKCTMIKCGSKGINICQHLQWLILTIIYAIRLVDGTAGADSLQYRMAFEQGYKVSEELVFIWLNQLVRMFTDNYHYLFFVVYAIFVFGLLYFERNMFDKKEPISIFLLYSSMYITAFGVMRQWIGISLGMIAFVLCSKGQYKKAVLVSLVGVGFHNTIIVYFVLIVGYLVIKEKIKKMNYRQMIMAAIAVNFFFFMIRELFISFMSTTEYVNYVSASALSEFSWIGYVPAIFFLLITLFYSKNLRFSEKGAESCELGLLFMWTNLSLMYAAIALGMGRLYIIFFPIRVFMVSRMRRVISKRFTVGSPPANSMKYIYDLIILFDWLLIMWRTIRNGALPYLVDWNIL